jgi:MEMO1 family protein
VTRAGLAVREPAVAGTFYPADPARLARSVDALLDAAEAVASAPRKAGRPTALVVPHAGHVYSGPVAATAYAHLRPHAQACTRVVLLGPSHFVPLRSLAVPAATGFATPLGVVPVDVPACLELAASFADVAVADGPHADEHALEVQLPFLQRLLPAGFSVLPVLVGGAAPDTVADVLDALRALADEHTVVLVSTDLSHYLDQEAATRRDGATAEAVVRRDPDAIGSRDACGAVPLRGLLGWARRHDLPVTLLDRRTSADTAGGRRQVVGYAAFRVG